MGTPEEFGASPEEDEEPSKQSTSQANYKTGKRLFRNPEDEVLGGVCSGIAAYFGIQDPLWVRLAFIVITISGGVGVLAYLILWAVLPKAESAGDRLSMRGEPINVSNIGRIIEEEIDKFSSKMSELGEELSDKW
ncbi:MAG: PspC domain-containing protein, partial [Phaeodactylibacter sp.]|nr:PspC domain-containing protein [Phaeodactylibacter sp.]